MFTRLFDLFSNDDFIDCHSICISLDVSYSSLPLFVCCEVYTLMLTLPPSLSLSLSLSCFLQTVYRRESPSRIFHIVRRRRHRVSHYDYHFSRERSISLRSS